MSGKAFFDTNIFVYASDRSHTEKRRRAEELIIEAIAARTGAVSYQVVQEFLNVALIRFAKPLTIAEAERYVTNVFQPLLTVQSSQPLLIQALRMRDRYRLSWYDALIVAAAAESDCDLLYSEDFQDGQKFGRCTVRNPFR